MAQNTSVVNPNEEHLLRAIAVMTSIMYGKYRRDGHTPACVHSLRVMTAMDNVDEMIPAVLHDVLETQGLKFADAILESYPPFVRETVLALTRVPGETYKGYILRVASSGFLARKIKIADLIDNMLSNLADGGGNHPAYPTLYFRHEQALLALGVDPADYLIAVG